MTAKISASADGLKVTIGNAAEDALEIDQTAKTIKPVAPYVIQSGATPQTWQIVAGRNQGIPYTNNTGREIDVAITFSSTPGSTATINVGGVEILFPSCPAGGVFTGVIFSVPNGAVYFINFSATTTINKWVELR